MVRLRRKDLAVKRLSLRQPPGSVVLNRNLKRLWEGHGGRMKYEG
jgi:hypothetical protein